MASRSCVLAWSIISRSLSLAVRISRSSFFCCFIFVFLKGKRRDREKKRQRFREVDEHVGGRFVLAQSPDEQRNGGVAQIGTRLSDTTGDTVYLDTCVHKWTGACFVVVGSGVDEGQHKRLLLLSTCGWVPIFSYFRSTSSGCYTIPKRQLKPSNKVKPSNKAAVTGTALLFRPSRARSHPIL